MRDKSTRILLERLIVGPFQSNCWILGCKETLEGIVIDPGDEAKRILKTIEKHELTLKQVIHTHGHLDHVSATSVIQQETDALVLMHEADEFLLENLSLQASTFGIPAPEVPVVNQHIHEGDEFSFGVHTLSVIETPGHSPGGVCLRLEEEKLLFAGDTLFAGSIGRTDLWDASYKQLIRSISEKLLPLDDDMVIHPGHGPSTTLEDEKRYNPFLQEL